LYLCAGHPYVLQLGRIYLDMLNVYKVMSENITAAITHHGEQVSCTVSISRDGNRGIRFGSL
jgi:hypothetical protein